MNFLAIFCKSTSDCQRCYTQNSANPYNLYCICKFKEFSQMCLSIRSCYFYITLRPGNHQTPGSHNLHQPNTGQAVNRVKSCPSSCSNKPVDELVRALLSFKRPLLSVDMTVGMYDSVERYPVNPAISRCTLQSWGWQLLTSWNVSIFCEYCRAKYLVLSRMSWFLTQCSMTRQCVLKGSTQVVDPDHSFRMRMTS